ncbi:nitrite/sulfite reductase [Pectinatus haikarae]|uniref:nitrite/sulfite reductase n=1 Tax=Pectinatus haikarae TaxID=349096 RepID=UPI0018C7BABD|nr:nitrite/sulfite reductase [Pectinatus haikarae]
MSYSAIWSENKNLNAVEKTKLKKDGLDIINEIIDKYSKTGYESIDPEDIGLFKWAGVYEQKPKNGYFMLRVRMTSGIMNAAQAKTLADIAEKYGRGIANITTRGSVQFHWIKIENIPDIFYKLKSCGMSSFEACGDCTRSIVGNPLTGIDREELIDTSSIVKEVNDFFLLNRDFSNLPRKYKISISGSIYNTAHAQINDISFTPAIKTVDGEDVLGFHVWLGGGLSSTPHLAKKLNIFARQSDVLKIAEAVCIIFRDNGYREKRIRARLKFLLDDWGVEKFESKIKELTGPLLKSGIDKTVSWNASYYYGIHPQKQKGKSFVGLNIPFGEITARDLAELASIADACGDQKLRTTLSQNIIISGIDDNAVPQLIKKNIFTRLPIMPKNFLGYTVACTGNEFCNLAIVETKNRARQVTSYLDKKIAMEIPVRIHFTGCPNSCGQKHIADISLQGGRIKTEDGIKDAFTLWAGGTLEGCGHFAEKIKDLTDADEVQFILEKMLLFYKKNSLPGENFTSFVNREGIDRLKNAAIV